jgi:hypothetical protein
MPEALGFIIAAISGLTGLVWGYFWGRCDGERSRESRLGLKHGVINER